MNAERNGECEFPGSPSSSKTSTRHDNISGIPFKGFTPEEHQQIVKNNSATLKLISSVQIESLVTCIAATADMDTISTINHPSTKSQTSLVVSSANCKSSSSKRVMSNSNSVSATANTPAVLTMNTEAQIHAVVKNAEEKEEVRTDPRRLDGYLVMCQNCGIGTEDLHICQWCKRKLPPNHQLIPDTWKAKNILKTEIMHPIQVQAVDSSDYESDEGASPSVSDSDATSVSSRSSSLGALKIVCQRTHLEGSPSSAKQGCPVPSASSTPKNSIGSKRQRLKMSQRRRTKSERNSRADKAAGPSVIIEEPVVLNEEFEEMMRYFSSEDELDETDYSTFLKISTIVEEEPLQRVLAAETEPEVLFSESAIANIQHQMRQHIQLLAQTYVMTASIDEPYFKTLARSTKRLIVEINNFAIANGDNSNFRVSNLDPAWQVVNSWPHKSSARTPIKKKILEEKYITDYQTERTDESYQQPLDFFPRHLVKVIAESPAFCYPKLLPVYPNQNVCTNKSCFTTSEDLLLICGLEELRDTEMKLQLHSKTKLLSQILLTAKSPLRIFGRIRNLRKAAIEHPLVSSAATLYFESGIVPAGAEARVLAPFIPVPPIAQPREMLPNQWNALISKLGFLPETVKPPTVSAVPDVKIENHKSTEVEVTNKRSNPRKSKANTPGPAKKLKGEAQIEQEGYEQIEEITLSSDDEQEGDEAVKANTILNIMMYDGMPVLQQDILCLADEQFLNDSIIDFWMRYIVNKIMIPKERARTYMFSTFFYKRLTTKNKKGLEEGKDELVLSGAEKRHARVKRWTKDVDIFEKDFVFIPINENCHWFLAVICYPGLKGIHDMTTGKPMPDYKKGKTNSDELRIKQPCILIFDSLAGEPRSLVGSTLREYLKIEYKTRKGEEREFTKFSMPDAMPKVPQQPNRWDCGIFMLLYVEYFFRWPIHSFDMPMDEMNLWYQMEWDKKREEIFKSVKGLVEELRPENLSLIPPLTFSPRPPKETVIRKMQKEQIEPAPVEKLKRVPCKEEPMDVDVCASPSTDQADQSISGEGVKTKRIFNSRERTPLRQSITEMVRASPTDNDHDKDYPPIPLRDNKP